MNSPTRPFPLVPVVALLALLGCPGTADTGTPRTCDDITTAFDAELAAVQACTSDDQCGQVLTGTSCGCTRDRVARTGADTADLYALMESAAEDECDLGLTSVCDCPQAYGYECAAKPEVSTTHECTWDYAQGDWLPDCRADRGDDYDVYAASILADELTVMVATGGGCETHEWVLCWPDGAFAESDPVQAQLEIWHDAHDDSCDGWLTADVVFDLTPLRQAWTEAYGGGTGTIIVNVGGESLTWSF